MNVSPISRMRYAFLLFFIQPAFCNDVAEAEPTANHRDKSKYPRVRQTIDVLSTVVWGQSYDAVVLLVRISVTIYIFVYFRAVLSLCCSHVMAD